MDKSEEFNLWCDRRIRRYRWEGMVSVPKIVTGGLPSGARDVAVNDLAAQRFGVGPGDHLDMVGYSPAAYEACFTDPSSCVADLALGEVTVSGMIRLPSDLSPEAAGSLDDRAVDGSRPEWAPIVASQFWISGAWVESPAVREDLGAALTDAIGPERIIGRGRRRLPGSQQRGRP